MHAVPFVHCWGEKVSE